MKKALKDYQNRKRMEKIKKANLENVSEELPDFINMLVLLLNSGLVLISAVERIAEEEREGYFYEELKKISDRMKSLNSSFVTEFREFARESGSRELLRLSNVFSDNIGKGSELVEKMELESAYMWQMRKKQVEEKGRLAESKLTFPMSLMLVSLIIIAAAPAFIIF